MEEKNEPGGIVGEKNGKTLEGQRGFKGAGLVTKLIERHRRSADESDE